MTFGYNAELQVYQPTEAMVDIHWDIVADGCETHFTFMGALAAMEGSIILTES